MNATLRRLSGVVMVMFLALMVSTTWIQFVSAESLNSDGRNVRGIYSALARDRGPIVVSDGKAIVTSVPVDDNYKYQRTYSEGDGGAAAVYAPVTGYFSVNGTVTGMERYANSYLAGEDDSLWLDRLQNLITGEEAQGSSVELTIDPEVQKAAWDALGDRNGAAVALDPKTGAILAMVSKPSYDPNTLAVHDAGEATAASEALINDKPVIGSVDGEERRSVYGPTINRTINATFPPGSTFKLLTSAAAIEYDGVTPDTSIPAPDSYTLPGTSTPVQNFGGESCSSTGEMTLKAALAMSCNTAFLDLANQVGKDGMQQMFQDFGFTESLEIPMTTSVGAYPGLIGGENDDDSDARIALSGMGQGSVRMTPLQVAMISAAIANDGDLMEPYLIQSVRDSDLELVSQTKPSRYKSPFSSSTAEALTDMMLEVVNGDTGTGSGAQIPGVQVAGKTGTAEDDPRSPTLWFTSFAPADDPQVAVAVVLENEGQSTNETTGGALASPIAAQIMQAAIQQ
ncbi:peptidoglycan D,D-transpeptidase FtsI family protein [Promicromonospora sp. NPDC050880]|uniref:peptidoglycan D,D-transpeptidase FtsI family protein n=1 Tax=unclassified Promicromonospora TaxID=2647929 RepID=UPI0037B319A8